MMVANNVVVHDPVNHQVRVQWTPKVRVFGILDQPRAEGASIVARCTVGIHSMNEMVPPSVLKHVLGEIFRFESRMGRLGLLRKTTSRLAPRPVLLWPLCWAMGRIESHWCSSWSTVRCLVGIVFGILANS
jgi:hypothetical protein